MGRAVLLVGPLILIISSTVVAVELVVALFPAVFPLFVVIAILLPAFSILAKQVSLSPLLPPTPTPVSFYSALIIIAQVLFATPRV